MRIREAAPADEQQVYALLCALQRTELPREAFSRVYAGNLARPLVRYLVAEDDGAVRGFISVHMDEQLHHATLVGEVQELIVDQAYRGKRLGHALLEAAHQAARDAGCSHMELNSSFGRTEAHAFYERHGWKKQSYNFTNKQLWEGHTL